MCVRCQTLRVCVCVCGRCQTPFSSRHESGQGLFLSKVKHQAVGQLPRVSFSAQPGQRSGRPNLSPHKKTFDFSVSFRQCTDNALESMQLPREAKNRSFNVQTVWLEGWTSCHDGKFVVNSSFYTPPWSSSIVQLTSHDQMTVENDGLL